MATATSRADRDSSPAFVLDTESSQAPLMVQTSGDTPSGSFIVLTLVTDGRSCPDTRNTVTFENRPTVNQRLMEIASSTVATTASNCEDHAITTTHQLPNQPKAVTSTPMRNPETATTMVRTIKTISPQEHGKTTTLTVHVTAAEKRATCKGTVLRPTYTVTSAAPEPMIQ